MTHRCVGRKSGAAKRRMLGSEEDYHGSGWCAVAFDGECCGV